MLPTQSIALAVTTFVGQNLGKNQPERARKGINLSLLTAALSTCVLMIPVIIFAKPIAEFFKGDDPGIVEFATLFLQTLTPFYVLFSINQILVGALRGAGNSRAPMIISLCSFVAFRQVYLFIMSLVWNEAVPIGMAYPAGWFLCTVIMFIYYKKVKLGKTRLVND
jgi:Na+-driven multidrug efflux pump